MTAAVAPRGELDATASIVARRSGSSSVVDVRGDGVLSPRRSLAGVLLTASTAGPLGGDRHRVEVVVGDEATLRVGSVSSPVVLPGTGAAARVAVDAEVGAGAVLRWTPEPTVVSEAARLISTASITVGPGASVVWEERIVLGRSGEAAGSAELRLDVVGPDGALCRHGWRLGAGAAGWDGPGGLGGRRVLASRLVVDAAVASGPPRSIAHDGVVGGVWSHDGWSVVTVAADEVPALDVALAELT